MVLTFFISSPLGVELVLGRRAPLLPRREALRVAHNNLETF